MHDIAYKNRLLAVLMVILAFNYVDRFALGVVLEDIKLDLQLSDTQLGFLSGIAFALFYAVMGIPIARWADRGNRVTIITLTTALWSAAVALCGVAGNFAQLLLIRVGVAVGEAGCIPPAHSLIADTFSRAERPRAVARYLLGTPLALIVGYFAAGWLNELYGWRTTFIILGLPGLALALLARLTLKEPRIIATGPTALRTPGTAGAHSPQPTARAVLTTLLANATFRHLMLCYSIWYFFGYGLLQWQPTFFIRSHGLHSGELGIWLAIVYGGGGLLGTYIGGELASRYATNNERLQLIAVGALFIVFSVFNIGSYLAPNHYLAFASLTIASVGGQMTNGPFLATIQTLVPGHMRAMSLALLYLLANFIGMGLGPLAAGALSDALRPWAGEESLRYALLVFCPGYFWAAWHLWRASLTVERDVAMVGERHPGLESGAYEATSASSKGVLFSSTDGDAGVAPRLRHSGN
jgi:MFS transporter, Spinster family, sphingosine-1-phosphate transporter